jgi:ferredoxin
MEKTDSSTVQINEKINKENHVYSAGNVTSFFNMLDESEFLSVGYCLCRYEKELIGDHCRIDMPMETCISVGPAAEYLIEQGISRKITKKEALSMIKDFQDKGCIHQTGRTIPLKNFKSKYPVDVICNCCWDCCGVVGNYNRGYLPLTVTSYYRSFLSDASKCTGCGKCVEFCPVGIITLNDKGIPEINDDLCIGCGQCQYHCPADAIDLKQDNRIVFLPMLGKEGARIKPPAELSDSDDSKDNDGIKNVSRDDVLKILEETREKFYRPDLHKVFKKWNKTMLYEFTDLNEFWHYVIKDGMPGPLKQGPVDDADIHYKLTGPVFAGLMKKEIDGFKAFRKKLVEVKAPVMDLIKLQKLIG